MIAYQTSADAHLCVRSAWGRTQTTTTQLAAGKACWHFRRVDIGEGEHEVAAGLVYSQASFLCFSKLEERAGRGGRRDQEGPLASNMGRRRQPIANAANSFEAHA